MDDPRPSQSTPDTTTSHASISPGEARQTPSGDTSRSSVRVYDRPKRTLSPTIIIAAIILLLILGIMLATFIL